MFSEEDAEYSEALKMGPISAAVLDGDPKEPRVGMVRPFPTVQLGPDYETSQFNSINSHKNLIIRSPLIT